jgi:hypothetical protein
MRRDVGAHAGDTAKATLAILTPEQRRRAKQWRQTGLEIWEVAEEMGLPEDAVALALANVRTKRGDPPRATLNVSPAAAELVKCAQRPGEPIWMTVNRLLGI